MNRSTHTALALAATLALLAGCETSPEAIKPTAAAPIQTRSVTAPGTGSAGATSTAAAQSQVATVNLAGAGAAGASTSGANRAAGAGATAMLAAPTQRIVYFDFDSFVIKDEFKPAVEGHAKSMMSNRQRRMVVEGHADERGSREYNLALGQKRAESVVKSLGLLGVGPAQVEAVSFGEERPAVQGSDEAAWAKNRRAELKDK